jgi:hypothetical protein
LQQQIVLRRFAQCWPSEITREAGLAKSTVDIQLIKKECRTMRPRIEREGHDRTIDLVAVIALLIAVFGSICYLSSPSSEQITTAFIVPSQSVRW